MEDADDTLIYVMRSTHCSCMLDQSQNSQKHTEGFEKAFWHLYVNYSLHENIFQCAKKYVVYYINQKRIHI